MDRWATFDCYGTLIDWNGGIGRELERLFGAEHVPRLLHGYHELERAYERERPAASYREVLTVALVRLAEREGLPLAADDEDALASSLPSWEPFPDVPAALEDARDRGWKLAILSNTDRDYIDASLERIGVPFELCDRRLGDRLVQAGAQALGVVRRQDGCPAERARPCRGEPLPRHRAGHRARPRDRLDQPARRGRRPGAGRRAALADRASATRSTRSRERQGDHGRRHRGDRAPRGR